MQPAVADPLPVLDGASPANIHIDTPNPNSMLVTQDGLTGIIDWQSFSIESGNSVHFNNGPGSTLNRVTGTVASQIDGSLTATGSLYLINQHGIAVGNNGMVATGGSFYASTQDLTNPGSIGTGDLKFSGSSDASVVNLGTIRSDRGDVALIARNVDNKDTISALNGTAALVSGYEVVARLTGDENGKFSVTVGGGFDDLVSTSGVIEAMNVELRAQGGSIEALAGNTNSVIKATAVQQQGGRIFLVQEPGYGGSVRVKAPVVARRPKEQPAQGWDGGNVVLAAGFVDIDGTIAVAGAGSGRAGSISVAGEYGVTLSGKLDASGAVGGAISIASTYGRIGIDGQVIADGTVGGQIVIAGPAVVNAGTVSASGTTGAGGSVVIASDVLIQHGTVQANSAASSGGSIDISYGRNYIDVASSRTTAHGRSGGTVHIRSSTDGGQFFSSGTIAAIGSNGVGGDVLIQAPNTLRLVGALIDVSGTIGGGDIRLDAGGGTDGGVMLAGPAHVRAEGGGGTVTYMQTQPTQPAAVAGPLANLELLDPTAGGGAFGFQVAALKSGNVVVLDPDAAGLGATYLFDGETGQLISALTGTARGPSSWTPRIVQLANGNYIVLNPSADTTTFGRGDTGVGGMISARNSLIGVSGQEGVLALKNGNYVVADHDMTTFGNGETGIVGQADETNSLINTHYTWFSGGNHLQELPSGHYVVTNESWSSATAANVGAVTFGNGWTGVSGAISEENSLVGDQAGDGIGSHDAAGVVGVKILDTGDYVVLSGGWRRTQGSLSGRGAVTLGSGQTGIRGVVSSSNSILGQTDGDGLGETFMDLGGGDFLVGSSEWDMAGIVDAGAVRWVRNGEGTSGTLTDENSLYGTRSGDWVGYGGVTMLANGNYVISSPYWNHDGADNAGAVTFVRRDLGLVGAVSAANSLVGTRTNDNVGQSITALTNGNYVVVSYLRDENDRMVGSATLVDGTTGSVGVVTRENSLLGAGDRDYNYMSATALANGNYIVQSNAFTYLPNWERDEYAAIAFGDGVTGVTGNIVDKSFYKGPPGNAWIMPLPSGAFLLVDNRGKNGVAENAGAVTFFDGLGTRIESIDASNSLIGTQPGDYVGDSTWRTLPNGDYIVVSSNWGGGRGAVTIGNGTSGTVGEVSAANSFIGTAPGHYPELWELRGGVFLLGMAGYDPDTGLFRVSLTHDIGRGLVGSPDASNSAMFDLPGLNHWYGTVSAFEDGSGFVFGAGRVIVFRTPLPPGVDPVSLVPQTPLATPLPIERNLRMQVAADGGMVTWQMPVDECREDAVQGNTCRFQPHPKNAAATGASL